MGSIIAYEGPAPSHAGSPPPSPPPPLAPPEMFSPSSPSPCPDGCAPADGIEYGPDDQALSNTRDAQLTITHGARHRRRLLFASMPRECPPGCG